MKNYRVFEIDNMRARLKGHISCRLDETEKVTFKKLREIGFNINRKMFKLVWWDDDYAEIVNKFTDKSIGMVEVIYA